MKRMRKAAESWATEKRLGGGVLLALAAAVAVFAVMLQIEKSALAQAEKGTVVVAVRAIPEGQLITAENREVYLGLREVEAALIPERAAATPEELEGRRTVFGIDGGTVLTSGMFCDGNEVTEGMEEPVIAGFKADDLYQVAGGVLRAGDRIHVYRVSDDREADLVWKDLYVQEVFDQAGRRIEKEDAETSAQRINVYLDGADVERFYSELAAGALRVVKVCR